MARKRMIDPNIWQSEDVSRLSIFGRLLFVGMISNADDYGKGRASAAYLRSAVFPYDDIRVSDVEKALSEISQNTSVILYEQAGNKYYLFENWNKWQKVDHPTDSIIPDPPEDFANQSRIVRESIPPNIREEKRIEKKIKEDIPKILLGEFQHVHMTQGHYDRLCSLYGQALTDDKIASLDARIQNKERKYMKFTDHYATIGTWCRADKDKQPQKEKVKNEYDLGIQVY